MDNKITKKDKSEHLEVSLLSEGSTEEMLREYAAQMFDETVIDPVVGVQAKDHAGLALKVEAGLEFMYIKSKIPRDMSLIRKSRRNRDMLAIYFFYGSTFDYFVENSVERSVQGLATGIIIHNYSSRVRLSLIKDREFNFVIIRISKEMLVKYFGSIAADLTGILFNQKPVLIYENLDQRILDHLKSVSHIQSVEHAKKHLIFGKSIELLALAFNLLLLRNHGSDIHVKIPEYDQIVRAKNHLISDWQDPPTIKQLSQFMGMSPTKSKMLFKQVFGYPPHQFLKRKKMEMAYQLILETEYNITEIGQQLGYKNMSQFSADFKRYSGNTPKKLKLNLKYLA